MMLEQTVSRYGLGNVLKSQLEFRKSKNDKYSLRALARDINVSPSTISKIINGKYAISDKMLEAILDCLNLESDVKERVIFFEKCRKLGDFLGVTKAADFDAGFHAMSLQKTIILDETLFPEFAHYLKAINEGFVAAAEAISKSNPTCIHLNYALNVTRGT